MGDIMDFYATRRHHKSIELAFAINGGIAIILFIIISKNYNILELAGLAFWLFILQYILLISPTLYKSIFFKTPHTLENIATLLEMRKQIDEDLKALGYKEDENSRLINNLIDRNSQ